MRPPKPIMLWLCGVPFWLLLPAHAAQAEDTVEARLRQLEARLRGQEALIAAQAQMIAQQRGEIDRLKTRAADEDVLALLRGRGYAQTGDGLPAPAPRLSAAPVAMQDSAPAGSTPPATPVGEAPPEPQQRIEEQVAAVPQGQGVLTPGGTLVFDPSVEYTRSSVNRLVFRGFELIPGIQVGLIEASDVDRDTVVETGALRYGITDRLEIEARLPLIYRRDRIEVVQQRNEGIVRTIQLKESAIGDAEFALRYQINRPTGPQDTIFVGSVRVKTDSGKGPFNIGYDDFGVATGLTTGSGFWAIQPGFNFLQPTDPAVIFGSISYLWHIPENVNRTVGDVLIGRVDPGDAISGNLGFGFALNPRFSFSLNYSHSYIFPTRTTINGVRLKSNELQVGSLGFGMSYRLTEKQAINFGFEFGVTSDAPDMTFSIRVPFAFRL